MQLSEFVVHDVSHFPAVRCAPGKVYPGYSRQWREELETLLTLDKPFFMVFEDGEFIEAPEDTRNRAVWLKKNKGCLSRVCKSIVSVEPDAERRCELAAQCPRLAKAFGIPRLVACDCDEAVQLGLIGL